MRRISAIAAMTALAVALLAGCSFRPDVPPPLPSAPASQEPGGPGAPGDPGDPARLAAAWLDGGRMLGLVTWGSSTCVPSATIRAAQGRTIDVGLRGAPAKACTSDFAPRVSLLRLPRGVDPAAGLRVRVMGDGIRGEVHVAGLAAATGPTSGPDDERPSAGWAGDGLLVLATYGSGCDPRVQDATPTGPAEVTVTFARPPQGQICTMQYGPRGSVAQVEGLEQTSGATAVLQGDGLESVRVPILGSD